MNDSKIGVPSQGPSPRTATLIDRVTDSEGAVAVLQEQVSVLFDRLNAVEVQVF